MAVNIWIEDFVEHIASSFFLFIKDVVCPGSHEAIFLVCVHRSFLKGFACTPFFWGAMQIHFTMCIDVLGRRRRMVRRL